MSSHVLALSAYYEFLPKASSTRTSMVMDQFGIGFEQGEHVITRELRVACDAGSIVLFTGESGSGKSSLLRAAAQMLRDRGERVLSVNEMTWSERALIDLMPCGLEDGLSLLTMCGLGEAQLLLRTPSELSDGQRYRFRLAMTLAQRPQWIVADEFAAVLDRRLARVIAANLKRVAARTGVGFLLATTHEDVVEDIAADQHVRCRLDGEIALVQGDLAIESVSPEQAGKKKYLLSPENVGLPPRPNPTGRISLGGIIAVTVSG